MKKIILAVFLVSLVLVFPVFAQDTETTDDSTGNTSSATPKSKSARPGIVKDRVQAAHEKNMEIKENLKMRASDAAQKRHEKLSDVRLRLCEARQKGISQRIKFMLNRGKIIHTGHEKIYQRVDEFYNNKLAPNGYTLSNYDDLKAEIEANKANVQTLLDAAKASGEAFDCSSDDPKGHAQAFHDDIKALIEANKEYKQSIHEFVKAVRDLAKTARLDKLSVTPSPSPSIAPEVTP